MERIYQTSDSAPRLFPAVRLFGNFFLADGYKDERMIAKGNHQQGDWGEANAPIIIGRKAEPLPKSFSIGWLSVLERKCYGLSEDINQALMEREWNRKDKQGNDLFQYLVLGMAPFGGVALWLRGETKSVIIGQFKAFDMTNDEMLAKRFLRGKSPAEISNEYLLAHGVLADQLNISGIPQPNLFDHWMQQFEYRFMPLEEFWNGEHWQEYDEDDSYYDDMELNVLEVQRYDGTHDQTNDFSLLRFHKVGMPKRLKVKWSAGSNEFSAYYWMNDVPTHHAFERLSMMSADERATLLLRIDTRQQHYEVALRTDDMGATALPQEAFEMLVFRDGKEHYRSPNFSQKDGAWNW